MNMKIDKKCTPLLTLQCVAFVLLTYSYVYVPPRLTLLRRQIEHEPSASDDPPTFCHSGFVLVLQYAGQQGAGVKELQSVLKWIKDLGLPMMVVEPFLQNSVMGVHPRKKGEEQSVKFSDVFDMDSFNAVSRSEGSPEMIAWSDYITNAPREAVFIKMQKSRQFQHPGIQQTIDKGPNECTVMTITAPDDTSVSLCQVREVSTYWNREKSTHKFSDEDVYGTVLRGLDPANVSLVFTLWASPWTFKDVTTNDDNSTDLDHKLKDSPKLHHYMEVYQNKFLTDPGDIESRYVAVMIRAEHSLLQLMAEKRFNIPANIQECLYELQTKTKEAMSAVGTNKLLVTSDVGNYGSISWHGRGKQMVVDIQHRVKRAVERLYKGREGWSFEQWEQSFIETLGGVTDRGYVAALQRVLAASNKTACLVLMGGGRFQELSLETYLHHTRHQPHKRCVYLVCMEKTFTDLFNSMLTKFEQ